MSNKFLIFKTQEGFLKKYLQIPKTSIAFIKDKGLIWTHDQYFGLSTGLEKAKGYFDSLQELTIKHPNPEIGDWAIIAHAVVDGEEKQWVVARCITKGVWSLTAQTYDRETFDLNEYVKKSDLDLSQFITNADLSDFVRNGDINLNLYATKEELYRALSRILSGSNIQTDSELSSTSTNPVLNRIIAVALEGKANLSEVNQSLGEINTSLGLLGLSIEDVDDRVDTTNLNLSDLSDSVDSSLSSINQDISDIYDALDLKADKSLLSDYVLTDNLELIINQYLDQAEQSAEHAKGYWDSIQQLRTAIPSPEVGDWAIVAEDGVWYIYKCTTAGTWTKGPEFTSEAPDLTEYAKKSQVQTVADSLASLRTSTTQRDDELEAMINGLDRTVSNHTTSITNINQSITNINNQIDDLELTTSDLNDDIQDRINDLLESIEDELDEIREKYISWYTGNESQGGNGQHHTPGKNSGMVTLSEEEYQALVAADEVDLNTYYFTYNAADYPEHTTWTFGDKFPVTFTEQWAFGGTFPITLQ